MKRYRFLVVSFVIMFIGTVFLSFRITHNLNHYLDKKDEISKSLEFRERLADPCEWYPIFDCGDEKNSLYFRLDSQADVYYDSAYYDGIILFVLVGAFMFLNFIFSRKKENSLQIMGMAIILSALSFLYLGIQSPFLELEFYNQDLTFDVDLELTEVSQTFKGRVYYFYQNKSILQLISLLYEGGNFLVAFCLLLFSIIFPIFKIVSSLIVFISPQSKYAKGAVSIINKIGKWSMADVFVAAVFLAYFSFANMNVGVDTGSTTLLGTYFFLTFVILSIASGAYLKKIVKLDPDSTEL